MNLKVINKPQIKVQSISGKRPTTLVLVDLNELRPVEQIKEIVQMIVNRFQDDSDRWTVKLIDTLPVVFNIVPATSNTYYQFTISFPESIGDVQNGLITAIEKLSKRYLH